MRTTTNNSFNNKDAAATTDSHYETTYVDETVDGSTAEKVLDVTWFAAAIQKLDEGWPERWSKL